MPAGTWSCRRCGKANLPSAIDCPGYIRGPDGQKWGPCRGGVAETYGGFLVMPENRTEKKRPRWRGRLFAANRRHRKVAKGEDATSFEVAQAREKMCAARVRKRGRAAAAKAESVEQAPDRWPCQFCQDKDLLDVCNSSEKKECYKCSRPRPRWEDPDWMKTRWMCPNCSMWDLAKKRKTISGRGYDCSECAFGLANATGVLGGSSL